MATIEILHAKITERFADLIQQASTDLGELTLVIAREDLCAVAVALRDEPDFTFDMLVDVCGVDYLHYGLSEWETESATVTGFGRGVDRSQIVSQNNSASGMDSRLRGNDKIENDSVNEALAFPTAFSPAARFGVVYHLLSTIHNHRIRLRVFAEESDLIVPSVVDIWASANWFEREAFDLFGILFHGHPDLRRILTDYGFVGHPFRKDFPLIGNVEVRYDAKLKRVVYEPVSIEARVLEPKVIRHDNRYEVGE